MNGKLGKWIKIACGVALVAIVGFVLTGDGRGASTAPEAAKRPPTMVSFTNAEAKTFEDAIVTDGTIKAKYYSLVSPRIGGIIDEVFVREGNVVEAGKTKLFQIDNEKLSQSVDLSTQALVIAKSTLDERKAALVSAEADLSQAEKDFARIKNLYDQKVVTTSEYEQSETKVTQLDAARKVNETQVTLAEQSVKSSEISLEMAKKDYADSIMFAPIDGIVSGRYSEPGEMGKTDKSIIRIDDVKNLKAVAYLPGQYYPRINPGASRVQLTVLDRKIGEFPITYKSPAIDSALRTFEIWADVEGDGSYVVPGAQASIKTILRQSEGVGVPRDAIQYRDGKYWIFVPDGEAARMVEVRTGLETEGWTELLDSPVKAGDPVVTQGQFLLDDGYPIRERGK